MFQKVLIANRGVIAARILRTLDHLGIKSVAVYSEADKDNPYVAAATEAYSIGPPAARESYLNGERLIAVAKEAGAEAIHPGYGFLSENAEFARQVAAAGLQFIGPSASMIEAMGHKTRARDMVRDHGMPVGPGSKVLGDDVDAMKSAAEEIGYPVLIKPAGGGGGIGMLVAENADQLVSAVERASSLAANGFGNAEVYLEKLIDKPRHVEIQLLGDRHGQVRHLFERDCSVQRRHQKVIEEARAPGLEIGASKELCSRVAAALQKIGYDNVGTVEMLMDREGNFHFLEMNTRLQVEHGVTEEITGIDLVEAQLRSAAGERIDAILPQAIEPRGHAIQARIYAEDPVRFFPSPGPLKVFRPPTNSGVRIETGFAEGGTVTPFYDPLLAKVISHGPTRQAAIDKLCDALECFEIGGIKSNIPALLTALRSEIFVSGAVHTGLLGTLNNK